MKLIEISNLSKKYSQNSQETLKNVNVSIEKGEVISILGANGTGKTTFLKLISGLIKKYSGRINLTSISISYFFQNYKDTLLPWRTNLENLIFPLELRGHTKKEAVEKVKKYLKDKNLDFSLHKYPYQLSGGQKQILAIHRALVLDSDLYLLDEPFNSLDYNRGMKIENITLRKLRKKNNTGILVSHNIDEAILFADRVIVFGKGKETIKKDFKISLEEPRRLESITNREFIKKKKQILDYMKNEE